MPLTQLNYSQTSFNISDDGLAITYLSSLIWVLLIRRKLSLKITIAYKSKNLGQILALKTRGRLICGSSFCQQLFQGCLCKLMADRSNVRLADCINHPLDLSNSDCAIIIPRTMTYVPVRRSSPAVGGHLCSFPLLLGDGHLGR